ncbi:nucleoside hydrolase [Fructilactobacillus fructivorans]|uniref:Nucleoside hydrolase n=1 Tax=Fructilactobacillus fructivorans TaxID=1614 RepID=A0AAE6P1P5_9LACO|nr:nucleoside hydrolase [Fructilactobacillus fructivorans]KRK57468.1 inosine-uridine nucleoside N-ribohydrolase [Fructilactobacillus fructivorans]KRN12382.1 inosine-uridine nucleoside N-ribohydrolase [Fructilactobacillus fructivorans]KRN41124.1 inosine-uridine nucleoside N-ribohydrolase [Fructilactobacillus fructivorans]KRN42227.1 inosine-uridine nucleoside N-ribohydrolase [Fructilactobacillus fructivorans]QFX93145.1 nucleoside hydrolase [Fructilactobacillus fructivorans]
MSTRKMILDLDTGIDDSMALTYAVGDPAIDLIGVVASYGNIEAERAAVNTLKILDLLGASSVPVFIGETHPLSEDYVRMQVSADIHGENGIGNVPLPDPSGSVQDQNGVDFMIESAQKYGNDLTIVPTGPLTNLAKAIKQAPKAMAKVGNVTLMGGALTVPGNVTPVAEANINQDAISANEVFTSNLNINMVGLDVTLRTLLTKKETQQWRDSKTTAGKKMADIVDFYINIYADMYPELGGCSLHDPLAVGVAVDPSFVKFIDMNMVVTTKPDAYYARTIGDKNRLDDPNTNVKVAVAVDSKRYLKEFMKNMNNAFATM